MKAEEYMKAMIYHVVKDESDKVILHSVMEQYANQRIIEELERQVDKYFKQPTEIDLSKRLKDRIQELKKE